MKNWLVLIIAVFFYSCTNETVSEEKVEILNNDSLIEKASFKDSTTNSELAVQENPLTIEDIPKRWFKLNLQESKQYTINEWCEIQSSTIEFVQNDTQDWEVLVSYPTDSKSFKIIGFDASEISNDYETIIEGNFIIENPDYPDMDPEIYSFSWNKGMMYATFGGFYENETRMVSEQNKDNYELVKENCDYLDEDQER